MFLKVDISEDLIVPYNEQIVGFSSEQVDTQGYLDLKTRFKTEQDNWKICVKYPLVEDNTSYDVLFERPCLNAFGVIVSTLHLVMKFPSNKGTICTMYRDQKTTYECIFMPSFNL